MSNNKEVDFLHYNEQKVAFLCTILNKFVNYINELFRIITKRCLFKMSCYVESYLKESIKYVR